MCNADTHQQSLWHPEEPWQFLLFSVDWFYPHYEMTQEKLEMVVATLELLLVTLKEELKKPTELPYEEVVSYLNEDDVDEYYEEEFDV